MAYTYPLLSFLIFLPLLGAGLMLLIRQKDTEQEAKNARNVALWLSLINLCMAGFMLWHFTPAETAMQFVEKTAWLPMFHINYHLGVDGISILFVVLTALLTPICILVSWHAITENVRFYMAAFLALESFVIGVFCALDFILFYIFWEAMLIPMFLIIGIWGGENRVYATLKFFLYTFLGSVLMLVAILYMYQQTGTFDILTLQNQHFSLMEQKWLFLALFAAFAVKVPMWPFHTWLPDAHVQAPTAGSVILAGILLKMGAYGFLRFSLPMFPEASQYFAPMVFTLSAIAIVWAALVAFAQTDVKKMIAYSSVSHMGFVTLGIFAGTEDALQGAVLQMVNHGIVAAGLFMLIGVVYDRLHTRNITYFGGIVTRMPVYSVIFLIFVLASVAVPGTNSFVGEFLVLSGSFPISQGAVFVGVSGVVLGALYMLWLTRKMIFGEAKTDAIRALQDVSPREIIMFLPLLALIFYIGILPNHTLNITKASVQKLQAEYAMPVPTHTHQLLKQEKPHAH